jgi:hypothetical protein
MAAVFSGRTFKEIAVKRLTRSPSRSTRFEFPKWVYSEGYFALFTGNNGTLIVTRQTWFASD